MGVQPRPPSYLPRWNNPGLQLHSISPRLTCGACASVHVHQLQPHAHPFASHQWPEVEDECNAACTCRPCDPCLAVRRRCCGFADAAGAAAGAAACRAPAHAARVSQGSQGWWGHGHGRLPMVSGPACCAYMPLSRHDRHTCVDGAVRTAAPSCVGSRKAGTSPLLVLHPHSMLHAQHAALQRTTGRPS